MDITMHDNHDGTMYTETFVTKIINEDGTEADEIVVDKLNSSTTGPGSDLRLRERLQADRSCP